MAAGQTMTLELTGFPHRPEWPRNVALGLTLLVLTAGGVAAFRRRPAEPGRTQTDRLRAVRDRLLTDLAALDARHAADRTPDARYGSERARLVAQLERVYAQLDDLAAA